MSPSASPAALVKLFRIRADLRCVTSLHISSPTTTLISASDRTILRNNRGTPIIPGSTLKGALRCSLESLLRAAKPAQNDHHWVCDTGNTTRCTSSGSDGDKEQGLCLICQTFGTTGYTSRLIFQDAIRIGEAPHSVIREGIGIDRDLGRMAPDSSYTYEIVPEGSQFTAHISLEADQDWQCGLLVLGLNLLGHGQVRIGGMKSRGFGQVCVENHQVIEYSASQILSHAEPRQLPWDEFESTSLTALRTRLGMEEA